jgi:hypothetical protein
MQLNLSNQPASNETLAPVEQTHNADLFRQISVKFIDRADWLVSNLTRASHVAVVME